MALIQFGKKEIEVLEKANQKLIQELGKEKALGEKLNALLISKEKEIYELRQQLRDIEKIKIDNQKLEKIINTSNKNSKATLENIDTIRKLKEEGHSFRSIAKTFSEATGTPFAHSTGPGIYIINTSNSMYRGAAQNLCFSRGQASTLSNKSV